jgi:hypothetical protein
MRAILDPGELDMGKYLGGRAKVKAINKIRDSSCAGTWEVLGHVQVR